MKVLFSEVEIRTYLKSFTDWAPELLHDIAKRAFSFLFIAPQSWEIGLKRIAPLLNRPNSEFVFDFMFDFFNRFAEQQRPQVVASLGRLVALEPRQADPLDRILADDMTSARGRPKS